MIDKPDINSYIWKNFKTPISQRNEKNICLFMIDTLNKYIELYKSKKRDKLNFKHLLKNNNEIINLSSLKDLHLIKNIDFRNLMHIQIEEEIILDNNKQFFVKKLNEIS